MDPLLKPSVDRETAKRGRGARYVDTGSTTSKDLKGRVFKSRVTLHLSQIAYKVWEEKCPGKSACNGFFTTVRKMLIGVGACGVYGRGGYLNPCL